MDIELRQYLDRKFAEMDAKFATKQDIERLKAALLAEFNKRDSPAEARARTHAAVLRAIDWELENRS